MSPPDKPTYTWTFKDKADARRWLEPHCHAVDCSAAVPVGVLLCREHMTMLPDDLRQELRRWFRPGQWWEGWPSPEFQYASLRTRVWLAEAEGRPVPGFMRSGLHVLERERSKVGSRRQPEAGRRSTEAETRSNETRSTEEEPQTDLFDSQRAPAPPPPEDAAFEIDDGTDEEAEHALSLTLLDLLERAESEEIPYTEAVAEPGGSRFIRKQASLFGEE